ncbi:hypothetical protein J3A83DRAFT_4371016 [Scleroderma citrinum]
MQYNNMYAHGHDGRQPYPSPGQHHPRPPANPHPSGSVDQSHLQVASYPPINAIVQGDYIGGSIENASQSHPYPPYPPQGPSVPRDDNRSYLSPQGSQNEYYPPPHPQSHSYATMPSGHMDPRSARSPSRAPQQFIPTPSQTYQSYSHSTSTVPQSSTQRRPSIDPYYHMSPNPQHPSHPVLSLPHTGSGSGIHPGPQHSVSQSQSSNPPGERYPCELCDRTFTRSHDRRRHYDTVHAASVLHRCRYCQKEFSRADSLKRHIDNGCDEMPSHR